MNIISTAAVVTISILSSSVLAQTQTELNQHARSELQADDSELAVLCKELRSKLDVGGRAQLQASQEAWLNYRQSQSTLETLAIGSGTSTPALQAVAGAELTRERIERLRRLLYALTNPR